MIGIIYKYTSPSGKVYIGQTTQESRRRSVFLDPDKQYGGKKIDDARRKYTPQAFSYEVLCRITFNSAEEARLKLDELERYYIKYYDAYRKGYNMTFGGYTTTGMRASEETRLKLSQIRKGRPGTPRTEMQKKRHSDRMKALYANDEYRAERARINASEDHRRKLSRSLMGDKNGMYGRKHSPESRALMSSARRGENNVWFAKKKSTEYREKIRESAKAYHKANPVKEQTKEKIREKISVPVKQFTLQGEFIAEFESTTSAGKAIGIDNSCIVKCCKGKRASAGGFKWEYSNKVSMSEDIDNTLWIGTGEAIKLVHRERNVLYYHMDVIRDLPFKINGRKRYLHKPTLEKIFR